MFTHMFHILEVLAIHRSGADIKTIVDMGPEWTAQKTRVVLKSLQKEGYVDSRMLGRKMLYKLTPKAVEYTTRIADLSARKIQEDHTSLLIKGAEQWAHGDMQRNGVVPLTEDYVWSVMDCVVSSWRDKGINTEAADFYRNCSEKEFKALLKGVKSEHVYGISATLSQKDA